MKQLAEKGEKPENVAYFVLRSIAETVKKVGKKAREKYGDIPMMYSGGVASNSLLRGEITDGIFAGPQYSTDNAMGTAILTYRAVMENGK